MVAVAKGRINILFRMAAERAVAGELDYSRRYVELALRLGTRYNIRIPTDFYGQYCRKCRSYLLPGRTSRVRFTRGKLTITCLSCGNLIRHPYRREQKARRGGNRDA